VTQDLQELEKGGAMRNKYRLLTAIEFAVVSSVIAGFGALGIAGLFFGFQMGKWSEWQQVIAGMVVTVAAIFAAMVGAHAGIHSSR
jgi:hypothetical protein